MHAWLERLGHWEQKEFEDGMGKSAEYSWLVDPRLVVEVCAWLVSENQHSHARYRWHDHDQCHQGQHCRHCFLISHHLPPHPPKTSGGGLLDSIVDLRYSGHQPRLPLRRVSWLWLRSLPCQLCTSPLPFTRIQGAYLMNVFGWRTISLSIDALGEDYLWKQCLTCATNGSWNPSWNLTYELSKSLPAEVTGLK